VKIQALIVTAKALVAGDQGRVAMEKN